MTGENGDASDEKPDICSNQVRPQVRLIDGPDVRTGRVEVKLHGVWGTVCGNSFFGEEEAKVVCRWLGFSTSNAQRYHLTHHFEGTGPIWIRLNSTSKCNGNESTLAECKDADQWKHEVHCDHYEDVAVKCDA